MEEITGSENLIARYLNGECTDSELSELHDIISRNDQTREDFFAIKDTWDALVPVRKDTQERLLQFYKSRYERSKKSYRLTWLRVASVAALIITGWIGTQLFQRTDPFGSENRQVVSVPLGSRTRVQLPDGTEINLNSGSELAYPENFSSDNRMVTLSGEAFFHVKSDPRHPFVVKTKDFDIQVTGTQFNVCSYPEDQLISATLAEGKISLKINDGAFIREIQPGEKFSLNRASSAYSLERADLIQETAWKDGEFIFRNISFPELVKRLERWYDVKLKITDARLIKYNYTGSFKNQETIWQVLDALKITSPIDFQKTTFREFSLKYKQN